MYNIEQIWRVSAESYVLEYNTSLIVSVYSAKDRSEIDMWNLMEPYADVDEFARDVDEWLARND